MAGGIYPCMGYMGIHRRMVTDLVACSLAMYNEFMVFYFMQRIVFDELHIRVPFPFLILHFLCLALEHLILLI